MRSGIGKTVSALTFFAAAAVGAQSPARVDTIIEARRLRDAGQFAAAAAILAPYIFDHPDDPGTARMAALMSYWSKDLRIARATYAVALQNHPNDVDLRTEFAQFLIDVGDLSQARAVIAPLVETGPRELAATHRAIMLLGTIDYWQGDFSRARKLFIETLRLDSTDATARRQLREIELASAAWIRAGASVWHDDQPLDHSGLELAGGWFATPLTPVTLRTGSTRFTHDDVTETVSRADLTFATYLAAARLDVSLGAGVLARTFGERSDWTGRASLGVRLPRNVVIEGMAERAPYLNTTASLATTVMTQALAGTLRWRARNGWMGDATARHESFDDDNTMTTAYAWLLAPVLRRSAGELHLGYSFAAQAAERSRFLARPEELNFPPGQAPATVRGYYNPYHTPRDLRVHSALVAATLRPGPRWSLSANGTVGIHARDDAPVLVVVPNPPNVSIVRAYYPREFSPWNLRGALEASATEAVRMALTAEHGKGAYYTFTTAGVRLTYTFVAAARRRADRY